MKTLTWQKPGQQNVAQELIKIIINYVAELRDIWFTPCYNENSVLSLSEQRYVIYVLLQHGLSVRRDCESGDIYINRSATLKN